METSLAHRQGHFCNGLPSQAGSFPSRDGTLCNAMHNFDGGNIHGVYQPGFVQCMLRSCRLY